MSDVSVFVSFFRSFPHLVRLLLSLFWLYMTLGWRVRKARRAFERQLVLQGMRREDARRLSQCYVELKDNLLNALKRGAFSV